MSTPRRCPQRLRLSPPADRQPDRGDGSLQRDQHHLRLRPVFTGRVHRPQTTELPGGHGHVTGSRDRRRGPTRHRGSSFVKEGTGSHICRSCLAGLTRVPQRPPHRQRRWNKDKHIGRCSAIRWCCGGSCGRETSSNG